MLECAVMYPPIPPTPRNKMRVSCMWQVLNGLEVLIGPKFFCVDLSHDWLKILKDWTVLIFYLCINFLWLPHWVVFSCDKRPIGLQRTIILTVYLVVYFISQSASMFAPNIVLREDHVAEKKIFGILFPSGTF